MNIPDNFSRSLEIVFGLKYINFWMRIRIRYLLDPGSGMDKFGSEIRYKHPEFATLTTWIPTLSLTPFINPNVTEKG
jgi:hypothetical protein